MRGCGRPGCDAPAAATIGFDGRRRAAWLHPLDEPEATGRLCQRHANTFRVPRGWRFFDYRDADAMAEAPEVVEAPSEAQPKPALVAASGIDLDDLLDAQ